MPEFRKHPLHSRRRFAHHLLRNAGVAFVVISIALAIGVLGYHALDGLPWVDSLLNASMILGGMGPVDPLHNAASKLFASFYALFSGLLFIGVAGVLFAPVFNRFLRRFHLDLAEEEKRGKK